MKTFNDVMKMMFLLAAINLIGCSQEELIDSVSSSEFSENSIVQKEDVLLENNYKYTCNYFVDSDIGDDNNNGRSKVTPWKTFDQASQYSRDIGYVAGDAVCFKRGQRFNVLDGRLGNGSSGTIGNNIFYGAYGDSNLGKPVLSPSLNIATLNDWQGEAGWLADVGSGRDTPAEWVVQGGGVFLWPNYHASWHSTALWEDNVILPEATTAALTDGDWYLEPDVGLYYRSSNGAAPATHELFFARKAAVFAIHQMNNLVITDLAFEYAETGLSGNYLSLLSTISGSAIPVHHIAIINNTFSYMRTAIVFSGGVVNKNTSQEAMIEPYALNISSNAITDIRYAIRLQTTNSAAGFKDIKITDNTIRNIAVGGAYIPGNGTDVEAISLQNPTDTVISGNDLRVGLKEAEGLEGNFGARFSAAIIVWRHDDVVLRNIVIKKNFVSDVSRGFIIGAGVSDSMKNIQVINNISINNEIGFKLNNIDSENTYTFAYNTANNNDTNFAFSPIKGRVTIGNLSANPKINHVILYGAGGVSTVDYNAYIPDGQFFIPPRTGFPEGTTYTNLSEWKQSFFNVDANAKTGADAQFVGSTLVNPVDFSLSQISPAVDSALDEITGINEDFGLGVRVTNGVKDTGAWER